MKILSRGLRATMLREALTAGCAEATTPEREATGELLVAEGHLALGGSTPRERGSGRTLWFRLPDARAAFVLLHRGLTKQGEEEVQRLADDMLARRRPCLDGQGPKAQQAACDMVAAHHKLPVFLVHFRDWTADPGDSPHFEREVPGEDEAAVRREAEAWAEDCEVVDVEATLPG